MSAQVKPDESILEALEFSPACGGWTDEFWVHHPCDRTATIVHTVHGCSAHLKCPECHRNKMHAVQRAIANAGMVLCRNCPGTAFSTAEAFLTPRQL